jgi:hypothetical protein
MDSDFGVGESLRQEREDLALARSRAERRLGRGDLFSPT